MEFFITLFLLTAIAASVYFFKSRALELEMVRLRRRYRTNDGTDLREAYDIVIDDYNTLVHKAKKILKEPLS